MRKKRKEKKQIYGPKRLVSHIYDLRMATPPDLRYSSLLPTLYIRAFALLSANESQTNFLSLLCRWILSKFSTQFPCFSILIAAHIYTTPSSPPSSSSLSSFASLQGIPSISGFLSHRFSATKRRRSFVVVVSVLVCMPQI